MIVKRYRAAYWDDGNPTARILNTYSRGLDESQLTKLAADDSLRFSDIKPEKGYSFIHLITTGAGERYGPNANADFFNETAKTVDFPEGLTKTASLDEGLKKYHSTYKQFGAVYRDHKNSKSGAKPEGEIVWESYNEPMHRGELVVKLPNEKWAMELQKMASGEPLYFSQGCGVPFDICSVCGNRAKTRKSYCEHLLFQKLAIHPSGTQIYAYNDQPHFHDISLVSKPADRIAFGLTKIARDAAGTMVDEYLMEDDVYIPASLYEVLNGGKGRDRYALLEKLAKIEKEVACETSDENDDLCNACSLSDDDENKVVKELGGMPLESLISSLINNKSMLTPKTFVRIVIGKPPEEVDGVRGFPQALSKIFSDLFDGGDLSEVLEDGSYAKGLKYPDRASDQKVKGLSDLLSLESEPIQHRIIKITISGGPDKKKTLDKKASHDEPTAQAKYLAKEYAKYQISFLSAVKDVDPVLAVMYNKHA